MSSGASEDTQTWRDKVGACFGGIFGLPADLATQYSRQMVYVLLGLLSVYLVPIFLEIYITIGICMGVWEYLKYVDVILNCCHCVDEDPQVST
jgi:hypothetical protein